MDTFTFPLTFNVAGIATHQEGTRAYYSQLIGNLAFVKTGDFPLRPDIGVEDISYTNQNDVTALVVAIAQNIPEIRITSIGSTSGAAGALLGTEQVIIDFEVI
jgi:hypothetical protein